MSQLWILLYELLSLIFSQSALCLSLLSQYPSLFLSSQPFSSFFLKINIFELPWTCTKIIFRFLTLTIKSKEHNAYSTSKKKCGHSSCSLGIALVMDSWLKPRAALIWQQAGNSISAGTSYSDLSSHTFPCWVRSLVPSSPPLTVHRLRAFHRPASD